MPKTVNIIGAGLAGCEAAWQISCAGGIKVRLFEMKPVKSSPVHKLPGFAEVVCSNSFRSNDPMNAAGLLKEEMRNLGSFIMEAADVTRVPAGKALAVDRKLFSEHITEKIKANKFIEVIISEITSLQDILLSGADPIVIATGPLTSAAFSGEIAKLTGREYLYFYDSVAPIVDAGSIDFSKGFKASRYGYGGADYWNFTLSKEEYENFIMDLASAEKVLPHEFEDPKYFEGCLPIEVMAARGSETLRYGPMKPFGLPDPKTGKEAYAVIQLRQDDATSSMFNMVGFQTRMTWPEQKRIFRKIPGLESAEFLRFGVIHRNTYINSPDLLSDVLEFKTRPNLFFAGQITGVEGYIESAATGLWIGRYLGELLNGRKLAPPPHTTALGSLIWHVANPNHRNFQPMNVNFGLMPILPQKISKAKRNAAMVERSRSDFSEWMKLVSKSDYESIQFEKK